MIVGPLQRILIASAGVLGALGVAAAAMAAHGGETPHFAAMSAMALAHAPVLLILGLAGRGRGLALAGLVIGLGCLVFVADLAFRTWIGMPLFPGAAPIGGVGMILGWLGLAFAASFPKLIHD